MTHNVFVVVGTFELKGPFVRDEDHLCGYIYISFLLDTSCQHILIIDVLQDFLVKLLFVNVFPTARPRQ